LVKALALRVQQNNATLAVKNFNSNFAVAKFLSHRFATGRFPCRLLSLLFFASLLGVAAGAADVPRWHAVSSGPYQSFSIADFDEDSRPDLAGVQRGKTNGRGADYLVQVQLSAAGRQTFQIVAPMGSVQIASRDVNGDNVLDLVLTSTWAKQPVAILLNDGRGSFSRVDPATFPEAFNESQPSWGCNTDHERDVVGVPPQSREDICSQIDFFRYVRSRSHFAAISDSQFGIGSFLASHSGRAPPFEIRLS
jgi:hypothetical protein